MNTQKCLHEHYMPHSHLYTQYTTCTNDVKGIMEDRTSSIDEAETDGGEMYCYTVNQKDDDSERSSPILLGLMVLPIKLYSFIVFGIL